MELAVAGFVGQAVDMFEMQAVVALRVAAVEQVRLRQVLVPPHPDDDEHPVMLAVR
jgi:hypothetical protein